MPVEPPTKYNIFSLSTQPPTLVGIYGLEAPPTQVVQIRDTYDNEWGMTPVGDDDKYHLRNTQYPYTGVIDNFVTSTVNKDQDVIWQFIFHEAHQGYTIVRADDPSLGWTVLQDGKIDVQAISSAPIPVQLFDYKKKSF